MSVTTSDTVAPVGAAVALNVEDVIAAMRRVVPDGPAALHEPMLTGGNEREFVLDCLDSGWVSYAGQYVERFELSLARAVGARHVVAMTSGTAALHIAFLVCGVAPGDEVLIPALTFVATANAVAHAGAIPHLVDSELSTLGIDVGRLSDYLASIAVMRDGRCYNKITSRRIAAVVPMHTFGHPVDMDALCAMADRFSIDVIEDAAESLGSLYNGRATGTFGRASVLSFNGNKIITTGGGGAMMTNDPELARRARHLTTTAKVPHQWEFCHDEIGYNYRMPSLNAALGCAQIERLNDFVEKKRQTAARYREAFANLSGVQFFTEPSFARSNYWLNALLIDAALAQDYRARDALLTALNAEGLMARPAWMLMSKLRMYSDCPRMDLSVAESIERRLVNIPSSVVLAAV